MSEWIEDFDSRSRGSLTVSGGPPIAIMLRFAGAVPAFPTETDVTYAIIKVAGKQYRVREGERLLVDRLAEDDGAMFTPTVLLVGGDGTPVLEPSDVKVTAKVLGAVKGPRSASGSTRSEPATAATPASAPRSRRSRSSPSAARRSARLRRPSPRPPSRSQHAGKRPLGSRQGHAGRLRGHDGGGDQVGGVRSGTRPMLAAALEYEQAHSKRKGAIAALESAIAAKEDES